MRMPYRIYKQGYTEYPATDYDKSTKTIDVQLPEYRKPMFPKEWRTESTGRKYFNHVQMFIRNSGLAECYDIEQLVKPYKHIRIECGLKAREKAIATFKELMIID
jgi:hypothetical protein